MPVETIMNDYGISKSLCYKLESREKAIKEILELNAQNKNRKTSKQSSEKYLDIAVMTWFQQVRDREDPISGPISQEIVRSLSEELNMSSKFQVSK